MKKPSNMPNQQISNNVAVSSFVSPNLAFDLMREGFAGESSFFWRRHGNQVTLDTFLFDVDSYYAIPNEVVHGQALPPDSFPAYTLGDVQKYLPDYCLCRVNNTYEISLDKNFDLAPQKSDRLPDAFALAALQALGKHSLPRKNTAPHA